MSCFEEEKTIRVVDGRECCFFSIFGLLSRLRVDCLVNGSDEIFVLKPKPLSVCTGSSSYYILFL